MRVSRVAVLVRVEVAVLAAQAVHGLVVLADLALRVERAVLRVAVRLGHHVRVQAPPPPLARRHTVLVRCRSARLPRGCRRGVIATGRVVAATVRTGRQAARLVVVTATAAAATAAPAAAAALAAAAAFAAAAVGMLRPCEQSSGWVFANAHAMRYLSHPRRDGPAVILHADAIGDLDLNVVVVLNLRRRRA